MFLTSLFHHTNKIIELSTFFVFNRFIIHNDKQNPTVSSLEDLDLFLKKGKYNPNLLVVSGLQMMDNYPFQIGN